MADDAYSSEDAVARRHSAVNKTTSLISNPEAMNRNVAQ